MESSISELEPVCSPRGVGQTSFNVVDGQEKHITRGSPSPISTRPCTAHRCQSMGVPSGSKSPFKQSGNVSNHKGSGSISGQNNELQCVDLYRQFCNGSDNQQTRGYQVLESDRSSLGPWDKDRLAKLCDKSQSHTGKVQCKGDAISRMNKVITSEWSINLVFYLMYMLELKII